MLNITESPAKATVNQGGLRLARGDLDGAESLYRDAIEIDPGNATAHANLGYLLALRGRHENAIAEAERAIALDPARSAPWAHMGMSQVATGSVDDGLSSLSRAVRLDPDGPCSPSAGPARPRSHGRRRSPLARTTWTCSSRSRQR